MLFEIIHPKSYFKTHKSLIIIEQQRIHCLSRVLFYAELKAKLTLKSDKSRTSQEKNKSNFELYD